MPTIENKMYGAPRPYTPQVDVVPCGLSTVDVRARILVNNVEHAGVVTHVCDKPKGHEAACMCKCGVVWVKNVR